MRCGPFRIFFPQHSLETEYVALRCGTEFSRKDFVKRKKTLRYQRCVALPSCGNPASRSLETEPLDRSYNDLLLVELFDVKYYRDLEMWVRGHSMSLKVVPFESFDTVSYSPSIVTMAVSVAVCEIFSLKEWCDLENRVRVRSRSLEMAPLYRSHTSSYSPSITTIAISCIVCEI